MQETLASTEHRVGPRCPFCFPPEFYPRQLLLTTQHFYLLAAGGQIVEGLICVITHSHSDEPKRLRCLADADTEAFDELDLLTDLIGDFYQDTYAKPPLFYENGRGGGTTNQHPSEGFEFHPHLCALPGRYELHAPLAEMYQKHAPTALGDLQKQVGRVPYLYVHTPTDPRHPDPTVYVARTAADEPGVVTASIRNVLALHNEQCRSREWRFDPGLDDLNATIRKFDRWFSEKYIDADTRSRFW